MRLKDRAEQLGFAYLCIERTLLPKDDLRIEDAVASYLRRSHHMVDSSEGAAFFVLQEAIRLMAGDPSVVARNSRVLPEYAASSTNSQKSLADYAAFCEAFDRLNTSVLRSLYEYWISTPNRAIWPRAGAHLQWQFVRSLLEDCKEAVRQIAFHRMHEYGMMGWPDLTCIQTGHVAFAEVKLGADRFTPRQIDWANRVLKPMKLNALLIHVT